ncbi:MAG: D-alanyl-D-alanine carboxypeptidase [Chloroflexi bacterium]|nr:D-alanyl-D-alanine carboxypeptidase [Chloroflexota bacterium]
MPLASNTHSPHKPPWAILLLILLALSSIAAGPPQLRSGHTRPIRLSPATIRSLTELRAGPQVDATAAIIMDRRSQTILWSKNADKALPMASTTKLMTAWVAMQHLQPDDIVIVSPAALVGNASIGLTTGEQVSVRTLLYGALLPSGNDAATQLAISAAGNVPTFVQWMNDQAQAWGLRNTHFVNPHGLDAPGHVSSARDLAVLADHVLNDPVLAEIVGTAAINIGGYALQSTNQLLSSFDGAYGVKTGTTDAAGEVLIEAARRPGGDVITVVLHSPNRFAETQQLLDFYFDHWQWIDVYLPASTLNTVMTPAGDRFVLSIPRRPLLLERWQVPQLQFYRALSFDVNSHRAGLLQVWLGEQKLLETPITFQLLANPISPAPVSPQATPTSYIKPSPLPLSTGTAAPLPLMDKK